MPPMTSTEKSVAEVSTTRKSHARASSNPPPTAMPCTEAIVGIQRDSRRRNAECTSLTKVRNIFRLQLRKFKHIGTIAEVFAFRSNYERPDIAYRPFVQN